MKVTFQVNFPIVNPVSGEHTWHNAAVGMVGLDLTVDQVFESVQNMLHITGCDGGIASVLFLAEQLRIVADGGIDENHRARFDAPPVTILWGRARDYGDIVDGTEVVVSINFNTGKIMVDCSEFTITSIWGHSSDIDWPTEFKAELDRALTRGLCR